MRWISDGPTVSHEHEQRTDAVRVVCAAFFRVLRYVYFKFMFNNEVQTQEKSQSRKRESRRPTRGARWRSYCTLVHPTLGLALAPALVRGRRRVRANRCAGRCAAHGRRRRHRGRRRRRRWSRGGRRGDGGSGDGGSGLGPPSAAAATLGAVLGGGRLIQLARDALGAVVVSSPWREWRTRIGCQHVHLGQG